MVVYLSIHNHDHRVDLSIDPPCYYVDDLKLDVSSDENRDLRMNDQLDDQNLDDDHRDVPVGHRMNVMDDPNDLRMVVNHVNRNCVLLDLMKDGNLDVSHDLRRNDRLDDLNLDVTKVGNRDHRMNGMDDRNLDVMMDVSRGLHMYDLLDGHLKDGDRHDVLVGHRTNVMDDRNDLNLDVSRVNRNYAPRDLKMDVNSDAMSHRVKLTGDRSMSCDRMSHDHLRCDHLMMRHRDTNRVDVMNLDGKNLDGKLKNSGATNSDARMV